MGDSDNESTAGSSGSLDRTARIKSESFFVLRGSATDVPYTNEETLSRSMGVQKEFFRAWQDRNAFKVCLATFEHKILTRRQNHLLRCVVLGWFYETRAGKARDRQNLLTIAGRVKHHLICDCFRSWAQHLRFKAELRRQQAVVENRWRKCRLSDVFLRWRRTFQICAEKEIIVKALSDRIKRRMLSAHFQLWRKRQAIQEDLSYRANLLLRLRSHRLQERALAVWSAAFREWYTDPRQEILAFRLWALHRKRRALQALKENRRMQQAKDQKLSLAQSLFVQIHAREAVRLVHAKAQEKNTTRREFLMRCDHRPQELAIAAKYADRWRMAVFRRKAARQRANGPEPAVLAEQKLSLLSELRALPLPPLRAQQKRTGINGAWMPKIGDSPSLPLQRRDYRSPPRVPRRDHMDLHRHWNSSRGHSHGWRRDTVVDVGRSPSQGSLSPRQRVLLIHEYLLEIKGLTDLQRHLITSPDLWQQKQLASETDLAMAEINRLLSSQESVIEGAREILYNPLS
eukprot:Clim_evm30s139 gene=Clim_evmTU30s139